MGLRAPCWGWGQGLGRTRFPVPWAGPSIHDGDRGCVVAPGVILSAFELLSRRDRGLCQGREWAVGVLGPGERPRPRPGWEAASHCHQCVTISVFCRGIWEDHLHPASSPGREGATLCADPDGPPLGPCHWPFPRGPAKPSVTFSLSCSRHSPPRGASVIPSRTFSWIPGGAPFLTPSVTGQGGCSLGFLVSASCPTNAI